MHLELKTNFFCLKRSYLKRMPGSESEKWAQVQGCERTPVARCAPPPDMFRKRFYVRVRASRGNSSSPWSREEEFDTRRRGKPVALLWVPILHPGGPLPSSHLSDRRALAPSCYPSSGRGLEAPEQPLAPSLHRLPGPDRAPALSAHLRSQVLGKRFKCRGK